MENKTKITKTTMYTTCSAERIGQTNKIKFYVHEDWPASFFSLCIEFGHCHLVCQHPPPTIQFHQNLNGNATNFCFHLISNESRNSGKMVARYDSQVCFSRMGWMGGGGWMRQCKSDFDEHTNRFEHQWNGIFLKKISSCSTSLLNGM